MKILYISTHRQLNLASPSGPGTHMREVIAGFEARGHEVVKWIAGGEKLESNNLQIVFKQRGYKKWIPTFVWHTLKDLELWSWNRKAQRQVDALIAAEKPDVVYERGYYMMTAVGRACAKYGVKHIIELNAPYPQEKREMEGRSLVSFLAEKAEKTQVKGAHAVVVVSSELKKYFSRKAAISPEKIVVTPNAVNLKTVHENAIEIRLSLGLNKEDCVVGFVGSIFPYHGVDLLIEAMKELMQSNDHSVQLKALVVGDGEILPELKRKVENWGLTSRFVFTGNVPHAQVYGYISAMDITVMPKSNWYGSPVKIFEYGIMGKLVIAPDNGPVKDAMVDGVDGLLVNETTEHLVHQLKRAIDHPKEMEQMAQHFQTKIRNQFTWQHVADRIIEAMK